MMGTRQKMNGDFYDVLIPWRHKLCVFSRAKVAHWTKKRMSRTRRRQSRHDLSLWGANSNIND